MRKQSSSSLASNIKRPEAQTDQLPKFHRLTFVAQKVSSLHLQNTVVLSQQDELVLVHPSPFEGQGKSLKHVKTKSGRSSATSKKPATDISQTVANIVALVGYNVAAQELAKHAPSQKGPQSRGSRKGSVKGGKAPISTTTIPPEAEQLFGPAPLTLRPPNNTRYDFPEEWLDNESVVRAARSTKNAFIQRDKTVEPSPEAVARARAAEAFIKAYYKRKRSISQDVT